MCTLLSSARQSRWFAAKDLIVVASTLEMFEKQHNKTMWIIRVKSERERGGSRRKQQDDRGKTCANGWTLLHCQRVGAIANNGNSFKPNRSVISSFFLSLTRCTSAKALRNYSAEFGSAITSHMSIVFYSNVVFLCVCHFILFICYVSATQNPSKVPTQQVEHTWHRMICMRRTSILLFNGKMHLYNWMLSSAGDEKRKKKNANAKWFNKLADKMKVVETCALSVLNPNEANANVHFIIIIVVSIIVTVSVLCWFWVMALLSRPEEQCATACWLHFQFSAYINRGNCNSQ